MKNDLLFYYLHNHWASVGITVEVCYNPEQIITAIERALTKL